MKKLALLTGLFLFSVNFYAQTDSTNIIDLTFEELLQLEISTVTKTSSTILDIPGVVTVITKTDIERMGLRKLSDVFAMLPGFGNIQNDDEHLFAVRGIYATTNQKFLILRDGHRLNEFLFDRIIGQYEITLENIKKIEIVRGPGASLYGNAAVTAVINLITNDTDNCSLSMGMGNYGQHSYDFVFFKNLSDQESLSLFAHNATTAGEPYTRSESEDYVAQNYAFSQEIKIDHYPNNYHFGFRYTKNTITISTDVTHSDYRMYWAQSGQNVDIELSPQDLRSESEDVRTTLVFSPKLNNSNWELNFQHHFNYSSVPQLSKMLANHLQYSPYGKMLSLGWKGYSLDANYYTVYTYKKGDILIGTTIENREVFESYFMSNWSNPEILAYSTTPLLPEGSEFRGASYFQMQHRFSKKILVNAGMRYDYAEKFNPTFNPRAAFIFQPNEKMAAKIVYTQAFQAPSYFYRESNPNLGYSSTENLNAEIMKSWQGILRYNFSHLTFIEMVYYYNHLDNLIRKEGTEYKNLGEITFQGIEITGNASFDKFSAFANFSWLMPVADKIDEVYKTQNLKDDQLKHLPEQSLNAGINYQFSKLLNVNLNAQWRSAFYTKTVFEPDYKIDSNLLFNTTLLSKDIIKGIDLSLSIYNLLNTQYKIGDPLAPSPLPQAGLWFLGKITYNL